LKPARKSGERFVRLSEQIVYRSQVVVRKHVVRVQFDCFQKARNDLKAAEASKKVKNQCMGECLAWKAMAYFFLVRSFGDVPIIHDNSAMLADGYATTLMALGGIEKAKDFLVQHKELKAVLLYSDEAHKGQIQKYVTENLTVEFENQTLSEN